MVIFHSKLLIYQRVLGSFGIDPNRNPQDPPSLEPLQPLRLKVVSRNQAAVFSIRIPTKWCPPQILVGL